MWNAKEWADLYGEEPADTNGVEWCECTCCGEEFPRDEMTKTGGLLFCRDCKDKLTD